MQIAPPTVATAARSAEVEELHALAELTGLVRFFHPSDEAANTPWDLFVVHAAAELLAEPGRQDERLAELFAPIAPTLQLAANRDALRPLDLPEGDGRLVAWGHEGVGLDRQDMEGHVSFRTHRPTWNMPDRAQATLYQNFKVPPNTSEAPFVTVRLGLQADALTTARIYLTANDENGEYIDETSALIYLLGGPDSKDTHIALQLPPHAHWLQVRLVTRPQHGMRIERVHVEGLSPQADTNTSVPLRLAPGGVNGWQVVGMAHEVVDDGASLRILSNGAFRDDAPFAPSTVLGDAVVTEIAPGLVAQVPLVLPTDAQSTLPRSTFDNEAWLRTLGSHNAADRSQPEVRVATVIQLWVVLRHLFPYRESVSEPWDNILDQALTDAIQADAAGLEGILQRMLLPLHDGHGNVFDHLAYHDFRCPVLFEESEGRFFVTGSNVAALQTGDELRTLFGEAIQARFAAEQSLISGSPQWKHFSALQNLRTARNGSWNATIRRGDESLEIAEQCTSWTPIPAGPSFRELGDDLVYVNISSQDWATDDNLARISAARGVIADLRRYPGQLRGLEMLYPTGTTVHGGWLRQLRWSRPDEPHESPPSGYVPDPKRAQDAGPVVWLIDAGAISTGESLLLAAHQAKQTMIGPRPTAGADGENRWFTLMGAWTISFTGNIARKMDDSPLYVVGFVPDITVALTPEGLAAGRDEVLEAAIVQLKAEVEGTK